MVKKILILLVVLMSLSRGEEGAQARDAHGVLILCRVVVPGGSYKDGCYNSHDRAWKNRYVQYVYWYLLPSSEPPLYFEVDQPTSHGPHILGYPQLIPREYMLRYAGIFLVAGAFAPAEAHLQCNHHYTLSILGALTGDPMAWTTFTWLC